MDSSTLVIDDIKKRFSFVHSGKNKVDHYFCSCGGYFFVDAGEETLDVLDIDDSYMVPENKVKEIEKVDEFDEYLTEVFKEIKTASKVDLICPNCNKNYKNPEERKTLIETGLYFISSFCYENKENELILYYDKGGAKIGNGKVNKNSLELDAKTRYLLFEKNSKKILFKDFEKKEREIDLDKVISTIEIFFSGDYKTIQNIMELHLYISFLAKHVIDINNINIVEELLSELKGKINDAGIKNIKKVISIFFGIIKYSNLSTIALTKGSRFLYDLMLECNIPKPKVLIENQVTSPVKIFNFLIQNYINKLNETINEDNRDVHDFVYESKLLIKVKNKEGYKSGKVVKADGKYQVLDVIEDGSISKFIYKNIRSFFDYEYLVKYLKFLNKNQLIELLQKYDINLLINMIDMIYFRDNIDMDEIKRLIPILTSYAEAKSWEANLTVTLKESEQGIDYSHVKTFDFIIFDDSIMMLDVLKFDRKKEFDKIKTYSHLKEYHDNLVRYFKATRDEDKNKKFRDFVERFKFLESSKDYDGPIELKLISTPGMLIKEGVEMKHSAVSYVSRVLTEHYLIAQIYDRSKGLPEDELVRFTIGFDFDDLSGLEFDQVKGIANAAGTDRFKKSLMEYLTAKDISFRPIRDLKLKNA